jgi:predicted XRE-type DNA-binding protein
MDKKTKLRRAKSMSRDLTRYDSGIVKALLLAGWMQSDIATLFGVNSGRIADVRLGYKHPHVPVADLADPDVEVHCHRMLVLMAARMQTHMANTFVRVIDTTSTTDD